VTCNHLSAFPTLLKVNYTFVNTDFKWTVLHNLNDENLCMPNLGLLFSFLSGNSVDVVLITQICVGTFQRFEHSNHFHKKIKTFVAFPEHLDMTPFMSHCRNHNNNNNINSYRGLNSVTVPDNR
jgi:hypothetical protein